MLDYLRMYLAIFGLWPGIPVKQQISFVIIWKPYKTPNKKEDWTKPFPRDYLWTLSKVVLY